MRSILVVGCGAIGGIYAAHLSRGADVVALDTNAEHVAAINREGLRLSGCTEMVARIPAITVPAAVASRRFDAVIMLVKAMLTESVFRALKPHLSGQPLMVTLQNGMGAAETLERLCDWDVAHGFSMEAGRYLGPGEIRHFIHGEDSWIGPARGTLESVAWLAEIMSECGIPTIAVADVRGAIWSKFIFNCVMNPLGAIVLGENRARYEVPEVALLVDDMMAEGIRVAQAQGIQLMFDPMHLVKKTRAGELPITKHASSMALDVAAGLDTEIEAITGYMVRTAKALGVAVPVTETVYRLAKGVEYAAKVKRGLA
ncbi:MAG: ketopantoate reductase family protein [Betaproteobacteria bacterium]|nr:ketopantoate reductase family protein [Betaproteobacteria bacterium]